MNEEFKAKLAALERELPSIAKRLPAIAKVEGLKFISENFKKQGFQKSKGSIDKWKNKKEGRKPNLIGEKRGGAMRRSWKGQTGDMKVAFTSNLPYTAVHNEGLKAGRPPGFTMKERRMIGPSDHLNDMIETKLDKLVDETLK